MRKSYSLWVHYLKNGQSRELPFTLGLRGWENLFLGEILFTPLIKYLYEFFCYMYIREKLFNHENIL